MDWVIYLVGAVIFFALVMASIALHEIGHLVPGKMFGVKTTQYFVGFGKTLWSRQRGETEYGFKAIPLGGYVRFVGMFPPAKNNPGQVRSARTGLFQRWPTTPARRSGRPSGPRTTAGCSTRRSLAEADHHGRRPDDEHPAGVRHPARRDRDVRRQPHPADGEPRPGVHRRGRPADTDCAGKPQTPADASGIRAGDPIVAFNGQPVGSWDEISVLIRANLDQPAPVTVVRDGQTIQLTTVDTVITGVPTAGTPPSGSPPASSGSSPSSSASAAVRSWCWRTCGR